MNRTRLGFVGILSTILVAGCGSDSGPNYTRVPVPGRVTLDNAPMTTGTVTFEADESKGNSTKVTATGMIDGSGQYKLFTSGKEGAPVGWYKVGVNPRG